MAYKRNSPQPVVEGGTGLQTATAHDVLVGAGTSAIALVAPSATSGIPLVSNGASADPSFTTAVVAGGGTGVVTMTTAYAPVCAGTTATGALQVASTGLSTAGFVLTSNGSSALPSFQSAAASPVVITAVVFGQSPYTVLTADEFLSVDVTGGAITIRLPNAPTTGRIITVKDYAGLSASSNITVTTVGGAVLIDAAATFVMNTAYQAINVVFDGSKYLVY